MPTLKRGRGDASAPASEPAAAKIELDPKYLNTPLNEEIVTKKLAVLASEWKGHRHELERALTAYADVARDLQETNPDDDDDEVNQAIEEIDQSVREVLDKIKEIEIRQHQLSALRTRYVGHEQVEKPLETYQQSVRKEYEEYTQKTARMKYLESKEYESFRFQSVNNDDPTQVPPSLKTYLKAEAGDAQDSDDDMEVTGAKKSLIDPLTLAVLKVPVKHNGCSHLMEEASARDFVRPGGKECPVQGCKAMWTTYEVDEVMKKRLATKAQKKTQAGKGATKKRVEKATLDVDDSD